MNKMIEAALSQRALLYLHYRNQLFNDPCGLCVNSQHINFFLAITDALIT